MKRLSLAGLSVNQKLAALAVVLGAVAVFGAPSGGSPMGDREFAINPRELAVMVAGEVDHVTAEELAGWILAGRSDYRLLDVRDAGAYAAYHVPTAESVPLAELPGYPLYRNEKVVLYSDGGIHSAQAWFLLKAQGFPGVYILLGGLDAWKDEVLFPALPAGAAAAEVAAFERRKQVAAFFGGTPRSGEEAVAPGAGGAMPTIEMPQVQMPAAAPVARPVKKKKEGC
jgi:rhodanese-related sulfurtransferase